MNLTAIVSLLGVLASARALLFVSGLVIGGMLAVSSTTYGAAMTSVVALWRELLAWVVHS